MTTATTSKKKNRVAVEIVRSTRKAHLITDGDRTGWIQQRWLREDGTVSEQTLAKAAASHDQRETAKQAARQWNDAFHTITVARETEKAVAFPVILSDAGHEQMIRRLAWCPKSLCRQTDSGDWQCPGWFAQRKVSEVLDEATRPHHRPFVEEVGIDGWSF